MPTFEPAAPTLSSSSGGATSSSGGSHECMSSTVATRKMSPSTVSDGVVADRLSSDDRPTTSNSNAHTFQNFGNAASQMFCNPLRKMVSQNRRRYEQEGFNLDLTYITDRIIAMGYPADTTEALYRNSMSHIVKFLETYHPGHYKVFNLRGQYVYDTSKFQNRVLSFEMTDHHPPRLELMAPFCREVHEYLAADPRNVVAVHCKAGKGRTGVMICAYLVYINFYLSPRQNMDYYSIVRTRNNKGVTIPSQRRYVYYFSHLRRQHLNYMPLRVELVGIYLERPPRVEGALSKGGLSIRVANGDVDVFLGKDMWIESEMWEAEETAWSDGVVAHEENLEHAGAPKIISRRAYGWTVPDKQRVFLEGDVRIDIYTKQKVRVLNIQHEKEKLGHVWLNTMFACPGFCGRPYKHGDEAHPYPPGASTIAETRPACRPKSGSASVPSSPPRSPNPSKNRSTGSVSGRSTTRAPSFEARKSSKTPRLQFNHPFKKIADVARNSDSHLERSNGENGNGVQSERARGHSRARRDEFESMSVDQVGEEQQLHLMRPPGLDVHCPPETIELLHGSNKEAPRVGIEQMLLDAHKKNLMQDVYNERRLSVPQEGRVVECAPEGRPNASGPNCITRKPDEHVQVYSVLEMDRACKRDEIDPGFKMIVVTRCVAAENASDQRLAESFMRVTHHKQAERDRRKRDKVEARQRKLGSGAQQQQGQCSAEAAAPADQLAHKTRADPRLNDPHLKKFFYRQRTDSTSVYPAQHYQCPLLSTGSHAHTPLTDRPLVRGVASSSTGEWSMAGGVTSPVVGGAEEGGASSPAVPAAAVVGREDVEVDMDVRCYHPEQCDWPHSGSASDDTSTTTSETDMSSVRREEDGGVSGEGAEEGAGEGGSPTGTLTAASSGHAPSAPPPS